MPRERSAKQSSHSAYEPLPAHHQLPTADMSHTEQPHQIMPVIQDPLPKKQFVCNSCDYVFTTSGHLARHATVHTGEKRHKCPFPGCETRCSRQDNLQQHYRVHLSPESRRRSTPATRSAMIKSYTGDAPAPPAGKKRSTKGLLAGPSPNSRKPRSKKSASPSSSNTQAESPPPVYNNTDDDLPGPDSPPLLVQANLPALMGPGYGMGAGRSGPSRSSSPLDYQLSSVLPNEYPDPAAYPAPLQYEDAGPQHPYPVEPHNQSQEQSVYYDQDVAQAHAQQGELANALHAVDLGSQQGYSQYEHMDSTQTTSPHLNGQYPTPSSRHSISHIAPTDAYPIATASETTLPPHMQSAPPSPPSDSPHSSGPITPVYTYREDYPRGNGSYEDVSYYGTHGGGLSPSDYGPHLVSHVHESFNHTGRYHQPSPPVLVPAQERLPYGDYQSHSQSQSQHHAQQQQQHIPSLSSPYLHHPRPITGAAQYHIPHLAIQPVDWAKAHGVPLATGGVGAMH